MLKMFTGLAELKSNVAIQIRPINYPEKIHGLQHCVWKCLEELPIKHRRFHVFLSNKTIFKCIPGSQLGHVRAVISECPNPLEQMFISQPCGNEAILVYTYTPFPSIVSGNVVLASL